MDISGLGQHKIVNISGLSQHVIVNISGLSQHIAAVDILGYNTLNPALNKAGERNTNVDITV